MKVYLIGIGGAAAAYLVELARQDGSEVSGSDASSTGSTAQMSDRGVVVHIPHNRSHIDKTIDEVWFSAAITENAPGHVELLRARELGIPTLTFAEASARFFNRARTRIAIAGTHGKSTTTAMVGWILEKNGYDPTVALGATMKMWNGSARVGSGDVFVIEADEYAKRFLELDPTHSVVTAVDPDHFDTYPDEDALFASFRQFVQSTVDTVVAHGDARVRAIMEDYNGRLMYYGFGQTDQTCDIWIERDETGMTFVMPLHLPMVLQVIGDHNLLNALASIVICSRVGVPYARGIRALADFPGVLRRFEYMGNMGDDVLVYDDYGHHPVEIEATLKAARQSFPDHYIILVHEPHQAGRLMHLMNQTAAALTKADHVVLLPVYVVRGREQEHDVLEATSERLAEQVKKLDGSVELVHDYTEALAAVQKAIKSKSLIITMGATEVWKVSKQLTHQS